jgi:hypothetical protein
MGSGEFRMKAAMLRDLAANTKDVGEKADLLFLAKEYDMAALADLSTAQPLVFPN